MMCHECESHGLERPAVAECRFCHVGLCKPHLVASYQSGVFPRYACDHHPERAFAEAPVRRDARLTAAPPR